MMLIAEQTKVDIPIGHSGPARVPGRREDIPAKPLAGPHVLLGLITLIPYSVEIPPLYLPVERARGGGGIHQSVEIKLWRASYTPSLLSFTQRDLRAVDELK